MKASFAAVLLVAFPSCSSLPPGTLRLVPANFAFEYTTSIGGMPVTARHAVGGKTVVSVDGRRTIGQK